MQKLSTCLSARHLSACLFDVSAIGAIIAAATANSRRLSQQNPYKTCVSLVELGQTSRHFIVHFEKIPTKKFPRYGRCARKCCQLDYCGFWMIWSVLFLVYLIRSSCRWSISKDPKIVLQQCFAWLMCVHLIKLFFCLQPLAYGMAPFTTITTCVQ